MPFLLKLGSPEMQEEQFQPMPIFLGGILLPST